MSYALAQAPSAPPSPVVEASYTPSAAPAASTPPAASSPRAARPAAPVVAASLDLDEAVGVTTASLDRIALR